MSRPYPKYEDGLDADGYAVSEPWCKPFVHGDETDAGDFRPLKLVDITCSALDRCLAIMDIGGNVESPIEAQVGAAVVLFFERAGFPLRLCKTIDLQNAPSGLVLVPQFAWSYYRSDWAILNPARQGALLIECDGKEFHSSADQKAHDAKKDLAALDQGFLTMRFTGSQIYRDADGCAQKIFDAVLGS